MKFRKLTSILVTGAMIASLGTATAIGSFAATDAADANEANIVKYLELGSGVTNPNEAFTFKFVQVDNGAKTAAIGDITITPTTDTAADDGNSAYGYASIKDYLPDYTAAGVYKYVVYEVAGSTEEMDYDDATYTITVTVINGEDGLEVKDIIAQEGGEVDPDTGEATAATEDASKKVDPSVTEPTEEPADGTKIPGAEDTDEDEGKDAENGTTLYGVTFDNNYQKTIKDPVDPTDPDNPTYGVLGVTKTVEGNYADKETTYPFEITITAPANYTDATEATAVYWKADGTTENITVKFGEATAFALADGEALTFETLPAGATYAVNEKLDEATVQNVTKYTASYALEGSSTATATGEKGAALATETIQMDDTKAGDDLAAYTNTLLDADVTPTGILMQNLPYILVAVLAAGGLVLYIVAKRRREDEEA